MLAGSLILKDKDKNLIIEIYDHEDEFIEENNKDFESKMALLVQKYSASFAYVSVISHNHMLPKERLIYRTKSHS